jgi:3-oxoacyl-[acyl-carrier protein] reductase
LSLSESLKGREILLVGGSGGIGSAVACSLLTEGARITISYRTQSERAQHWSPQAAIVKADITSRDDRKRLLDAAQTLYGLVVFAGDPVRVTSTEETEAAMLRSHSINYLGPTLLAREAAERMKTASTEGAIVLLSTMQANALFPGSTAYAAQKSALQQAARILAKECRGATNIRVNIVSPGVTAAGMAEASIASGKYDRFIKEGIINRFGQATDVARAVRFLLEPDNYVTGQIICVDGGITL